MVPSRSISPLQSYTPTNPQVRLRPDFHRQLGGLAAPDPGDDATAEERQLSPRARLPEQARKQLQFWLDNHRDRPYPLGDEKLALATLTKLTPIQVQQWFSNKRRRGFNPKSNVTPSGISETTSTRMAFDASKMGHDLGQLAQQMTVTHSPRTDGELYGPAGQAIQMHEPSNYPQRPSPTLQSYLYTHPRDENAPLVTSMNLMNNRRPRNFLPTPSYEKLPPDGSDSSWIRVPSADGGLGVGSIPMSRLSTQQSATSRLSNSSQGLTAGRKGRKLYPSGEQAPRAREGDKKFQCTWCYAGFSRRGDWQRHEEVQHAPQKIYECMPRGPRMLDDAGQQVCVFCDELEPTDEHLQNAHKVVNCLRAPHDERRFHRGDHLKRHVKDAHSTKSYHKSWEIPVYQAGMEPHYWCGFCARWLKTWKERVTHVAKHFVTENLDMMSWNMQAAGSEDLEHQAYYG